MATWSINLIQYGVWDIWMSWWSELSWLSIRSRISCNPILQCCFLSMLEGPVSSRVVKQGYLHNWWCNVWTNFFEVILVVVGKFEVIGSTYGKRVIICFGSKIWFCEDLSWLKATRFIFWYFEKPTCGRSILLMWIYKIDLDNFFVWWYDMWNYFGSGWAQFHAWTLSFVDPVISSIAEQRILSEQQQWITLCLARTIIWHS